MSPILKLTLFGADEYEATMCTYTLHQWFWDQALTHKDNRTCRKRGKWILAHGVARDDLLSVELFHCVAQQCPRAHVPWQIFVHECSMVAHYERNMKPE